MVQTVALGIFIGVGAVVLAVWPHEVGHSAVAYIFGCKESWWRTNVTWFLFNSEGGAIDYLCCLSRDRDGRGSGNPPLRGCKSPRVARRTRCRPFGTSPRASLPAHARANSRFRIGSSNSGSRGSRPRAEGST
jgi:hypothetical protein